MKKFVDINYLNKVYKNLTDVCTTSVDKITLQKKCCQKLS